MTCAIWLLHGQERNLGTLAAGKLNLLLHGLRAARLEAGDVIAEPGLVDPSGQPALLRPRHANPPFSLKNWGHDFAPNDRTTASTATVPFHPEQGGPGLPLAHAGGDRRAGHVGVLMPTAFLFRGGSEARYAGASLRQTCLRRSSALRPTSSSGPASRSLSAC